MSDSQIKTSLVTSFFLSLRNLHSGLQGAYRDVKESEQIPAWTLLCIKAVTGLEGNLSSTLRIMSELGEGDLKAILSFYSSDLLALSQQICEEDIPDLTRLFQEHIQNFSYYCRFKHIQEHPDEELPPGQVYSERIRKSYTLLLRQKACPEEWPWVSRQHLRLCMYTMERLQEFLRILASGKLPVMDEGDSAQDCFILAVEQMDRMNCFEKKRDFQFIFQKVREMNLFGKWSTYRCLELLSSCRISADVRPEGPSSLKRMAIHKSSCHPHWRIEDVSPEEELRLNALGTTFEHLYNRYMNE